MSLHVEGEPHCCKFFNQSLPECLLVSENKELSVSYLQNSTKPFRLFCICTINQRGKGHAHVCIAIFMRAVIDIAL